MNDPATIQSVQSATRSDWLDFCTTCDEATFFHTPYWAELFSRRYPERFNVASRLLQFSDGTRVLLPLVIKRHLWGLVRINCSMPGATYGGWLSPVPLTAEQKSAVLRYYVKCSNAIVRENPYAPFVAVAENVQFMEGVTQAVNLEKGYKTAWKSASHAHRKAVRNAQRHGLVCKESTAESEWDAYIKIYQASITRWKKRHIFTGVHYDAAFFREVRKLDRSLYRLWLVSLDNTIIAGILCFYWNRHAVAWHGAGLSGYFSYRPNNLLYNHAIMHAAENGYRWFDCNPSSDLSGVSTFKKLIGAQPLQSRVLVRRSQLFRILDLLRFWKVKNR